jgi:ATP/maltotriose-dependent transcriptional regulator MalT/DNA-binding SARP family transcriptional activator
MKGIPVIKSKLVMPQLPPTVIKSTRIRGLIESIEKKSIAVVTAPAGYGKTTLIAAALSPHKTKGDRICWYRLDEADSDLAYFYTHLVEALFPVEENIWEEARSYLDNCGDILTQHQYLNALFCQELWAFYSRCPDIKTFIVLDDFQQVQDIAEITGTVQFFMDNLPENFTVIISSRCETGLLTAKRRLEKSILEITSDDLCVTSEELPPLIENMTGIRPGQALSHKILLHTEGWPAGIILICQMLSSRNSTEIESLLDHSGQKELLFQYIISEVLTAVDDRLLRFLSKASLLPEITVSEAKVIFDEENALQLLEKCQRKGLFIQKLYGSTTTYRFHSLFRETLEQIRPQFLTTEEIKDYHMKAAAYYIENQLFERAIRHFIACGNIDRAVELVVLAARTNINLIAFEAFEQLRLWFKLLPEEVVNNNGYLLYIKSYIKIHKEPKEAIKLLEQSLEIFRQADDPIMQLYSLISLSNAYIECNSIRGLREFQERALMLSEGKKGQPIELMLTVIDFTVSVCEGNFTTGLSLLRSLKSLELTDEWQLIIKSFSSMMYYLLGDLEPAYKQIHEALELEICSAAELRNGYLLFYYCTILQLEDQLRPQSQELEKLIAIGEKYDYKHLLGSGKRLEAIACYRQHDLESALESLDASTSFFEGMGNTAMISSNTLYRCLWQCREGNPEELLSRAQSAIGDLTAEPSGMCLQEIGFSIVGAIAREAKDYRLSEKYLTASVEKCRSKGAKQILCGVYLHLARLYFDTNEHAKAGQYLRKAFDLAAKKKYYMFWDLHFPTLVEMAARAARNGIHIDYIRELINRHYGQEASEFLITAALTEDAPEKNFADLFIARYGVKEDYKGFTLSVKLLGRLHISINGIPVPNKEWKTKKIPGLFKFLIVHRGHAVSKEQLIEVFWPEADKRSVMMSLRAALCELKKTLRKQGLEAEDLSLLLKESRDTLEVLTGNHLIVDVDSFLELSGKHCMPSQKRAIFEEMLELYKGDFLEEDLYEDWTFAFREELRSVYFRSALELAGIYMTEHDNIKAEKLLLRMLSMDQYNEEACLLLLKLYFSENQRGRAVKLYKSFTTRFENDLQIKADDRLISLINES